jgi:nucleoside-diphosphate-sugar epimerase
MLDRVLVTGGQGFLGAFVIRELLQRGSSVTLLDVREDQHILEQVLSQEELSRVQSVFADITNATAVNAAVLSFKPSSIIHLAGVQIPTVKANPPLGVAINVMGTVNVLEAIRALASDSGRPPVPFVYASSAAALGPSSDYSTVGPLPAEQDYHKPRTLYGATKLCNEHSARVYWNDYRVPSVGLRPLTIFGVGREVGLTSGATKAVKAAVLGRRFDCGAMGLTGFHYVVDVARLLVDSAVALGHESSQGAHVFGVKGHLATYTQFFQEAQRVLPAIAHLTTINPNAVEVPIHGDVDETPLREFLGRDLHMSLSDAVGDMVSSFQELKRRGKLTDTDLGAEPPDSKL